MEGQQFRSSKNWLNFFEKEDKPIKYLEVGVHYGRNLFEVATETFAAHPESELHCIDPWEDYEEYPEYIGKQDSIYETFQKNFKKLPEADANKITIHRGYSRDLIPTFDDDSFDLIYIDGNHEPEYCLEDGVLAWRKLKPGGYLIFDDFGPDPITPTAGIRAFATGYQKVGEFVNGGVFDGQVCMRKKNLM
jgi:SAM-dependent methyltransferase